jgi:hypothetical protein
VASFVDPAISESQDPPAGIFMSWPGFQQQSAPPRKSEDQNRSARTTPPISECRLLSGSPTSAVRFEQSAHHASAGRLSAVQRVTVVRGGVEPPTFRFSGVAVPHVGRRRAWLDGARSAATGAVDCRCCRHHCRHICRVHLGLLPIALSECRLVEYQLMAESGPGSAPYPKMLATHRAAPASARGFLSGLTRFLR